MTKLEEVAASIYDAMDAADGLDTTAAAKYARAAIEAVREPDEAMLRAAYGASGKDEWTAMIDAILSDPTPRQDAVPEPEESSQ